MTVCCLNRLVAGALLLPLSPSSQRRGNSRPTPPPVATSASPLTEGGLQGGVKLNSQESRVSPHTARQAHPDTHAGT